MTERSNTPGPWHVVPWSNGDGGFNIFSAPHNHAGLNHPTSDYIGQTGVCPNPWQNGVREAAANAALMAAAPDLLRALQEIADVADDARVVNRLAEIERIANAAIAAVVANNGRER